MGSLVDRIRGWLAHESNPRTPRLTGRDLVVGSLDGKSPAFGCCNGPECGCSPSPQRAARVAVPPPPEPHDPMPPLEPPLSPPRDAEEVERLAAQSYPLSPPVADLVAEVERIKAFQDAGHRVTPSLARLFAAAERVKEGRA